MNKKNEITLWGYYGFNNLGDDVMLNVCLKEIKSTKKYETINVYGNYQTIDKVDGVVYHPLTGIKNKVEFLKSILKSDKLIWGGGTCFYKDNNTGYSGLFLLLIVSLYCVLFRKNNFFLGIGLGKLTSSLSRILTIITLSSSTLSIFRDVNSYNKALSLVNPKKVGFGGDLVLLYDILERNNKFYGIKRRYISVSGHYAYANDVGYIENFARAIIKIAKHNNIKDIVFVSMHQMPESNDHIFHEKLKDKLPDDLNFFFSDYVDSINFLKDSTFHIGMRLHSIVFASINSVPIVPFSYSPKINAFINTMFLDAKVFDGFSNMSNLSVDDLICKEINNENLNAEKNRASSTIKYVLSL